MTDLRMPVLALAAWAGCLVGATRLWWPVALLACGAVLLVRVRRPGAALPVAVLLVTLCAIVVAAVHRADVRANPVAGLAEQRASAAVRLRITGDPRTVPGRYGDVVVVRATMVGIRGRGAAFAVREPVLVFARDGWADVRLGSLVAASGLLSPAEDGDLAAVVSARGDPVLIDGPGPAWRAADAVRAAIRASVESRPPAQAALVPALVDGDDSSLDPALAEDFRATGLTHLLAVSGTNLTLIVGFLLLVARGLGVRGRWLSVVAVLGIAGFVALARTEPSVLRAAVMGGVGLLALTTHGRERGPRTLGVAVVVLLLVDPWLARSPGFTLSVLATAGIVLLAPGWRDALGRWLPRWVAETVAVPAAACLATTPVVAALSGQVSLVAVAANLAAAPAVGPATVLGLAGGLAHLAWPPLGSGCGTVAGWCVGWIVLVAQHGADLPTAALRWGTGPVSLAALTVLCAGLVLAAPLVLARPVGGVVCAAALVVGVLVRPPSPGWPPAGWVLVACDVGQGDALVLRAGPGAGVVVDAGPEPRLVDRCLDRLGVDRVPLLVLTHFHADHVDGVSGVLAGRTVDAVETTVLADPPAGVRLVQQALAPLERVARPTTYGQTRRIGEVTLQVLWPPAGAPTRGPGDGSTANEASVVLLTEVHGVRMLLTGDIEPTGQAALAAAFPDLRVDVLKVPHHGSRYQDLPWLVSLGAHVALVSVGADNDYGHPAAATLQPLVATGAIVLRTDLDGDLAVVAGRSGPTVVTSR